jgi:hypothetical protein
MQATITIFRLLVGAWMLWNGLNHWVGWTPQPLGDKSHYLHLALIQSGLFAIAKISEIAVGAALLANRMVPSLLVMTYPVSVIIAWMALVIEDPRPAGTILILAHTGLLIAYFPHLYPMLAWKARPIRSAGELGQDIAAIFAHADSDEPMAKIEDKANSR